MVYVQLAEEDMMKKPSSGKLSVPRSKFDSVLYFYALMLRKLRAKADMALQAKKKLLARQKETERKQVETLSRKHLAGLRVMQKNLVYVVGLNPKSREEELLQTLRGDQYFGQYGKIIKIVVGKVKEGANGSNSQGIYVTFARDEDAESCINAVNGSQNGDRVLR